LQQLNKVRIHKSPFRCNLTIGTRSTVSRWSAKHYRRWDLSASCNSWRLSQYLVSMGVDKLVRKQDQLSSMSNHYWGYSRVGWHRINTLAVWDQQLWLRIRVRS